MRYEFHTADVFTDRMFGGNQLAVIPDARGLTGQQMQSLAREFNLSETAFVLPAEQPRHARRVRIFTPGAEVPFAGHPTVGTAYVLAKIGDLGVVEGDNTVVLEEGVGPVPVRIEVRDGEPVFCELTAAQLPEFRRCDIDAAALAEMLGGSAADIGAGDLVPEFVSCGLPFLFVPMRSVERVEEVQLRRGVWRRLLEAAWSDLVYTFALGGRGAGVDVHARMFGPGVGVDEDPATGSAATALGAYLAARSGQGSGTLRWRVEQGLEIGRPSLLLAQADLADGAVRASRVGGTSVMAMRGSFDVEAPA